MASEVSNISSKSKPFSFRVNGMTHHVHMLGHAQSGHKLAQSGTCLRGQ